MITDWTSADIEAVLVQLNDQNLPFVNYSVVMEDGNLSFLGRGASAVIYRAWTRSNHKKGYAVKVIGFGDKHVESESFRRITGAQKDVGWLQKGIVKIYETAEIRVWIEGDNTVVKAEKINPYKKTTAEGNFLHLQFVVMEELVPVIKNGKFGKPVLFSRKLTDCSEEEILKLAYDIGTALSQAHSRGLIHRDVKLENIFYDPQRCHYKLGDFGIAKMTNDGFASTVAFTKGYGAPEVVGTLEDRYDHTADIYSFGMLLYVLLNELHFPASASYHPNIKQYSKGFVPEYPTMGSDEFCDIVLKMIRFDPDDRYQSMEEVINEFDKLKYGHRIKYRREHSSASLVLGTAFGLMGAVIWELSFLYDLNTYHTVWTYMFLLLCVLKGVLKLFKKDFTWASMILLGLGIWMVVSTGGAWWKMCIVLLLSLDEDIAVGVFGGGVLLMIITGLLMDLYPSSVGDFAELKWMALLLVTLAVSLLFYYSLLDAREEIALRMYLGKNMYWIIMLLLYSAMIIFEIQVRHPILKDYYERILSGETIRRIMEYKPMLSGILGLLFCLGWLGREKLLLYLERKQFLMSA